MIKIDSYTDKNSQCGFYFCGFWGDPDVGSLMPTHMTVHREIVFNGPT